MNFNPQNRQKVLLIATAAAIALYPNDPLVFASLASLSRSARHF